MPSVRPRQIPSLVLACICLSVPACESDVRDPGWAEPNLDSSVDEVDDAERSFTDEPLGPLDPSDDVEADEAVDWEFELIELDIPADDDSAAPLSVPMPLPLPWPWHGNNWSSVSDPPPPPPPNTPDIPRKPDQIDSGSTDSESPESEPPSTSVAPQPDPPQEDPKQ